jgi:hypothetical protein
MKISACTAFVAFAMVVAYDTAYGGVYIESVTRDKLSAAETSTQRMYVQDGMARIESSLSASITLFKGETLYVLDTTRKTYMAMDAATLERTMGAMSDVMKKMQERLASMPPEQRAMMENMMKQNGMPGAGGPAKAVVFDAIPLAATERAAGRSCKSWDITRDGAPHSQVCVVPYAGLPGKDDIQALAQRMSALLAKLPENLRGQYNGNPLQQNNALSAKLNGVPFITRNYRNGVLDGKETLVKTWQEQAVATKQFEIPADYVKQEMPATNRPAN